MADVTASWDASPSSNVTGYSISWVQNTNPAIVVLIPRTSAQDSSGYTSDFASATGITPAPGDVIGATLIVMDAVDKLQGPVQSFTPASVTIPTVPVAPQPATNLVLALS
jgi:hypothetical protein